MGKDERGGLPESDYHLDDSDVLVLRRQDGSFVAAFGAREVAWESIVEAAKEDQARCVQAHATGPSRLREDDARKATSANDDAGRGRLGADSGAYTGHERTSGDRRKAKKALRKRGSGARPPRPPAEGGEEESDGRPIGGAGNGFPGPPRVPEEHLPTTRHGQMRWYDPMLEDFGWREVPPTDERALEMLEGSQHSPACHEAYREWRELGATIGAALIRAGEAAKERSEVEKREDEGAP